MSLAILGIAFAVGLDVLALSIAIGVAERKVVARLWLAAWFSFAEVAMQVIGYAIGTGAGRAIGTVADYVGFLVLAGVGLFIFRESFASAKIHARLSGGWGLLAACGSASFDSLGVGVSLPGVPIPLVPLIATVAVSTVLFTVVGLGFGARLGESYEKLAERACGIVLMLMAVIFTAQRLLV